MLAPLLATYIYLNKQKKTIRKEVKHLIMEGIDQDKLTLLKFHKKEINHILQWKHSKEFSFQNHMYDIVEQCEIQDSIYYWCWPDDKETLLNKKLDDLVASILGLDPHRNNKNTQLFDFYNKLYCCTPVLKTNYSISMRKVTFFYKSLQNEEFIPTINPPPKIYT